MSPATLVSLIFIVPLLLLIAIISLGLYTHMLTSKFLDLLFLAWVGLGTVVITILLIVWW